MLCPTAAQAGARLTHLGVSAPPPGARCGSADLVDLDPVARVDDVDVERRAADPRAGVDLLDALADDVVESEEHLSPRASLAGHWRATTTARRAPMPITTSTSQLWGARQATRNPQRAGLAEITQTARTHSCNIPRSLREDRAARTQLLKTQRWGNNRHRANHTSTRHPDGTDRLGRARLGIGQEALPSAGPPTVHDEAEVLGLVAGCRLGL